jgi:hypothetical protein
MPISEVEITCAVAQYLTARPGAILFTHIANERKGLAMGRLLKRMGLRAGMPDFLILHESFDKKHSALLLEVKTLKGRLSESQKEVRDLVRRNPKLMWAVGYGLDETLDLIIEYFDGPKDTV